MNDSENVENEKDAYFSPVTDTQKKLIEIWQEILRIDKVNITDNFFKIGGNSLKAIKLVNLSLIHI